MGIKYLYYARSSKRAPDLLAGRRDQSLLLYPFHPISSIGKPISKPGQIALAWFPQSLPLSLPYRHFQTKPWMQVTGRAGSKAPGRQGSRPWWAGCQNQGVRPVPSQAPKYLTILITLIAFIERIFRLLDYLLFITIYIVFPKLNEKLTGKCNSIAII